MPTTWTQSSRPSTRASAAWSVLRSVSPEVSKSFATTLASTITLITTTSLRRITLQSRTTFMVAIASSPCSCTSTTWKKVARPCSRAQATLATVTTVSSPTGAIARAASRFGRVGVWRSFSTICSQTDTLRVPSTPCRFMADATSSKERSSHATAGSTTRTLARGRTTTPAT
eukprot:Amastigsp_a448_68.p3 type:complete len:172 gc:universal Amastigsp_a448_68:602-87(-)